MSYKLVCPVIAALAVLTTSCSYGSLYEAREAFQEWVKKGVKYTEKSDFYSGSRDAYNRYCDDEPETKKILGFENKEIESGKIYESGKSPGWNNAKVTKRFKY